MYFEDQLGIRPSEWFRWEPLDRFLAHNAIPIQDWEIRASSSADMHVTMFRMILSFLCSVLIGFVHRYVPTATGRHVYAVISGIALVYYPCGNEIYLLLVLCALVYALLLTAPRSSGVGAWAITLPYMLVCMERAGDLWDTGAVDATGALMVLLLKLVALGHNRQDGARSVGQHDVTPENSRKMISAAPNPLHYLSYCFACGNLLAGPFFEYNDYLEFTKRSGEFAQAFQSGMVMPALRAVRNNLATALLTVSLHLFLAAKVPATLIQGENVWKVPLAMRFVYALITGFGKRCQYYFVWALSEGSLNASGFGFNGFEDAEKRHPRFDKFLNTDIIKVETCVSLAVLPRFWNTNTGVFLRRYVYERVGGGFLGLAVTQLVSSVWHGLREGFVAFFVMSIFMFQASKLWFKHEGRLPAAVVSSYPWTGLKWLNSQVQLNVFCQPFLSLKWALWVETWKAMYFVPHVCAIGVCVAGSIIPPPRRRRSKAAVETHKPANSAVIKQD